jgi:hypothetical protein
MSIIQPRYSLTWATNDDFPAGPDSWALSPTKAGLSAPELAAGVAPKDQLAAQVLNFILNNALGHIAALSDVYALNWESFAPDASTPILVASGSEPLRVVSAQDATTGTPWLICRTSSTNIPARTRDFFRTVEDCGALSDGGPGVPITKLCADIDRTDRTAENGLLAMSAVSKVYPSTDVGATWGAGVAIGSVCTAIARSHPLGLVIVAGVNVVKTMTAALGSLTSRTVPGAWSALTPAGIATARGGESATAGAVIWPEESVTNVMYSADGVTWVDTSVASGRVVGATWSESQQSWFAVTTDGRVYASSDPANFGWTVRAALVPASSGRFSDIKAFGRNLIISGVQIGDGDNSTGSIVVTADFVAFHPLTTGTSEPGSTANPTVRESSLCHHDGRIVAAHSLQYADTFYHPHLSASMRAPWL